jgi:CHAD domain-containing protein
VQQQFLKEDIHQLRVSLKKIRSVFLLVEFLKPKKFSTKKNYTKVRPIFKSAGKIREIQINNQVLEKYPVKKATLKAYRGYNKKTNFKNKLELAKLLTKKKKSSLARVNFQVFSILHSSKDEKIKKKVKRFVNRKLIDVSSIFYRSFSENDLHEIRILVKQAYAIALISKNLKYKIISVDQLKLFKGIEENIGNWHDILVLQESLQDWRKNIKKKKRGRRQEISQIIRIIKKEKKEYRKKLKHQIPGLLDNFGIHKSN